VKTAGSSSKLPKTLRNFIKANSACAATSLRPTTSQLTSLYKRFCRTFPGMRCLTIHDVDKEETKRTVKNRAPFKLGVIHFNICPVPCQTDDYSYFGLLCYDVMYSGTYVPTFRRTYCGMNAVYSGILLRRRSRKQVPPKRWYIFTKPNGVTKR
jgi:hypothetical protein